MVFLAGALFLSRMAERPVAGRDALFRQARFVMLKHTPWKEDVDLLILKIQVEMRCNIDFNNFDWSNSFGFSKAPKNLPRTPSIIATYIGLPRPC